MKYTQEQIKELAKLGVIVNANGDNLSKETQLERKLRINEGIRENQRMSLKLKLVEDINSGNKLKSKKLGNKKEVSFSSKKTFSRPGIEDLTEAERRKRGLVTKRQDGIIYTLLEDNTKICRCCQQRKPGNSYSNLKKSKDGKMGICKACDHLSGKDYRASKKKAL